MKLSLNWLKEYIQTDLSVEELTDMLTAIGLEVEGVEQVESIPGGLRGLVIGEVLSCVPHENADRLKVCQVSLGNKESQIVCGAPNVAAGQKVIVAPVSTILYSQDKEGKRNSFEIKKAKIRGIESFGMICAEDEIGLGGSHEGILVLPQDAPIGTLAKEFFDVEEDTVIEIGLTPNRADANSHIGTARDLAAAISIQLNKKTKVQWPDVSSFEEGTAQLPIEVIIEDAQACPRYTGIIIDNIQVKESPSWLQNRLRAIGIKPMNNIVDITNFINHEYGQPLHAFDYKKISKQQIIVKKATKDQSFVTLDHVERKLSAEDLMICNATEPMCIAGVYGGLSSGVSSSTTSIFLECAYFDPKTIRKTLVRHQLRTDAALKYEKGIDPTKQLEVLKRATLLIQDIANGSIASPIIDSIAQEITPKQVILSIEKLKDLTGVEFTLSQTISILQALDFDILDQSQDSLTLQVPLYRSDVYREADVIEEILRIYGFNNVPLSGQTTFSLRQTEHFFDTFKENIANHLSARGLREIMTNSITQSSYYSKSHLKDSDFVRPLNSLNKHLDILRPEMLHTGLEVIAHNIKHNEPNCMFYELGKTYRKGKGIYIEKNKLAIYLSGAEQPSWHGSSVFSFYTLKEIVEQVLKLFRISSAQQQNSTHLYFTEGICYQFNQQPVVEMGEIKQDILESMDCKQNVYYAVFDLDVLCELYQKTKMQFQPISKFPAIQRDLSLVINQEVSYGQIDEIARQEKAKDLQWIELVNVFSDEKKLGKNKKSYALRFTFKNDKKTLQNKQIDKQMNRLMDVYKEKLNAVIRM